jgi:hypothetical protein
MLYPVIQKNPTDVINDYVEFKISEPQAYGFAIILNSFERKGGRANIYVNNNVKRNRFSLIF